MSTPNMPTITASLESSLQDCSLNQQQSTTTTTAASREADSTLNLPAPELNPQANPLPFNWEQCLDLKTGELYYINLSTGMKTKEDPRTSSDRGNRYSDEYDSEEGSSSESSSREQWSGNRNNNNSINTDVLVVAGCRSCFMYYMVPKQLQICSKCGGQLLHFDRPQHASS